jgi:hypothetical protein
MARGRHIGVGVKVKNDNSQPSFDFSEPSEKPPVVERRLSDIDTYVEQIARDTATLKMDETFWAPSREFYEERIVAYRETVKEMQK